MKKTLRTAYALGALFGLFIVVPSIASATEEAAAPGTSIKCEKCTCNWQLVCECTNCTISAT
jgi:hypothetical protein